MALIDDAPMDSEILELLLNGIELRFRFSKQDNMLNSPPTLDEKKECVRDGISTINEFPPQTAYTLSKIYDLYVTEVDARWWSLLGLASAKNIALMLMSHWAAEGFNSSIDELSSEDKFGNLSSLLTTLDEDLNNRLEKLKVSSQRYIKGFISNVDYCSQGMGMIKRSRSIRYNR